MSEVITLSLELAREQQELAAELVAKARAEGVELTGPDGLLTGLTKQVLETALEAGPSDHLGYDKHDPAGRNRGSSRNGTRSKTVLTVLGESVLAASLAAQRALDEGQKPGTLLSIAGSSVVIIFAMWWLYFDRPVHHLVTSPRVALLWGYGQYLIFAAAAAVGAGLAVNVDWQTGAAHLGRGAVGYATAMPVAVYLLAVWALHARPLSKTHGQRGVLGHCSGANTASTASATKPTTITWSAPGMGSTARPSTVDRCSLVLGPGDSAVSDGAVIVARADGAVETFPAGARIAMHD